MTQDRVAFANQLRGLAALGVVLIHYTVVYQVMRPTVAWVVAAPPYEGPLSPVAAWLFPPWFDGGAFGVALFFLISGFVIPFSLAGTTRWRFLAARALRIYPTFWAALLLEWCAMGLSGAYWGRPTVFGWQAFMLNGLLVNTVVGAGSVDFVSWTLTIEVKFYLLMALLRPAVLAFRVWPLLAVAVLAIGLTAGTGGRLPPQLVAEAMYVVFMLAGTLFHYHFRGALGAAGLAAGCVALAGAAGWCWAIGPEAAAWPNKPANYAYALALFALAYAARRHFRPLAVPDAFAAISYPLYLIHSVLGFTLLSFVIPAWGVPYPVAAVAVFGVVCLVAAGLHWVVERPSIRIGRRVTRASARPANVPVMAASRTRHI